MNLEKHLVLSKYFLHLVGYKEFDKLREDFNQSKEGFDAAGVSYVLHGITNKNPLITEHDLKRYDEAIKGYEDKLKANRNESDFSIKYFQYFAILFSEYYFDKLATNPAQLLTDLNAFATHYCTTENVKPISFSENDLRKLAYWMATGSGKTILMHINYWQMMKYFPDWENIILITPNAGLSRQHFEEYRLSGIPCKQYNGSEESLKTRGGEVLIIEVTKLTGEKKGDGVSVDVSYFSDNNNLVFIDEGHKGQSSEEKTWKNLRETLAKEGFIFEYSATFGQVIRKNTNLLLEEYSKAIIFDYSYRYFYQDGYGKDFFSYSTNLPEYNEMQTNLVLTAGLLAFYEQLEIFEKFKDELRQYKIEKPLWIFVGSKVVGKNQTKDGVQQVSDVVNIIAFLNRVMTNTDWLNSQVQLILSGKSGLNNTKGNDIFHDRFQYLKSNKVTAESILRKVFNGTGSLELFEIKNAEGEIALQAHNSEQYFGIINIGDVDGLKKKIKQTLPDIEVKPENILRSQFERINEINSPINMLIGSKKFIEGWNSWRVSNMGLLNMGSSEGPQIIQLFGRGVRLKGKNKSLKREDTQRYEVKTLQTLSIFGVNANYIKAFLDNIENEIEVPEKIEIPIRYNKKSDWENKIFTFKTNKGYNFKEEIVTLKYIPQIAQRINIDLRPKVVVTTGLGAEAAEPEAVNAGGNNPLVKPTLAAFINWNKLLVSLTTHKIARGYFNLIISKEVLQQVIAENNYSLCLPNDQFDTEDFSVHRKMNQYAEMILKDYLNKFYADNEKKYLTKNLKAHLLNTSLFPELFPEDEKIILQVPKRMIEEVKKLKEDIEQFYTMKTVERIPTIHFDKHLYSPIAAFKSGTDFEEIKSIPVKLNKDETHFVNHLRVYLTVHSEKFAGKEVFVLRNLSKGKGVGFFIESATFYPDFILWLKHDNHQDIIFIDPKGLMMLGGLHNEKVYFCTSIINEIQDALRLKLKEDGSKTQLNLWAYIISGTSFQKLNKHLNHTRQQFRDNHILFLEEDHQYLNELFEGKI